jgi:hypothetical protein
MSYLTWAIWRGLSTGHRWDNDQKKKMPPQTGGEKRTGGRKGSNGHDRGHVGRRDNCPKNNRLIYIYCFSISLNVSISAFSTRTRIPESPVETGTSTDKNICFPNRRAVRKSPLIKYRPSPTINGSPSLFAIERAKSELDDRNS